jgi:beta-glucanase (GH16 family)
MYHYTSGWVDSNFLFGQHEGRWEVRAKLPSPSRRAIWPAIWLMNCGSSPLSSSPSSSSSSAAAAAAESSGSSSAAAHIDPDIIATHQQNACSGQEQCWPMAGEIDIMEMVGLQQSGAVLSTYHWASQCNVDE